jgi:hypothetical protein
MVLCPLLAILVIKIMVRPKFRACFDVIGKGARGLECMEIPSLFCLYFYKLMLTNKGYLFIDLDFLLGNLGSNWQLVTVCNLGN